MSKKLDITQVVDEYLCHSCGACFASCGHDSISFVESIGGYYMPKIDYDTCTNCGLCFDVCSGDHFGDSLIKNLPQDPFVGDILESKIGIAKDKRIFENSQSGGIVTAILSDLLDNNKIEIAIVATTILNSSGDLRGDYVIIKNSKDLYSTQKSKYIPISMLQAIPQIKDIEGDIAFVGLSCHMHSLENLNNTYRWLRKKSFLKIGLICDRVLSNKIVDFIAYKATKKPIKNLVFRDKLKPSYPGNPTVTTYDDKTIILSQSLRVFMKDYFTPVRCRLCFDKLNIYADIVVGDPHGVKESDQKNGESLVFIRTLKGKEIINFTINNGSTNLRYCNTNEAINGQSIDKKRDSYRAFISAWNYLGKKLPENSVNIKLTNDFQKELELIQHALKLDEFKSKEELLKDANYYYRMKRLNLYIMLPSRVIRKLFKIIKKLLNKEK